MRSAPLLLMLLACHRSGAGETLTVDAPRGPLSAEAEGDATRIVDASGHAVAFSGPRGPGLSEWWVHGPEGVEHGFTVREPGSGAELRLALRIAGARVDTVEDDEARLVGDDGGRWRYAGLVVTDARGRTLPGRMEADPAGLALVVDTTDARYPIEIDPLLTTTSWTAEGATADSSYGWAAAAAGDVNGDGTPDVVIGAYTYGSGSSDEGRVYVYHGTGAATTLGAAVLAYDPTDDSDANFATAVAGAGDVDGDGYADILVGEPGYDGGATNEGRAWLFYGSASGVASAGSWSIHPTNAANAWFGHAVAGVDINGDGSSDVFVSAYGAEDGETDEGRVYGYYGATAGPSTGGEDWSAESNLANAEFGRALADGGDLDGDGYHELIVGAPYLDVTTDPGVVYIHFGSATGPDATPTTLTGLVAGEGFGAAVAGAGDVNDDGVDDLLVGAPYSDAGAIGGGRAALYLGMPGSGPDDVADWEILGGTASEARGSSVAGGGDVNGDGLSDVLIGAPGWTGASTAEGAAFAYHGSATSYLSTTEAWSTAGGQTGADLGRSVALPGDLDGDGFGEALVGVPLYDNGATDEGGVWVYPGANDDADGDGDEFWTDCDDADPSVYTGATEIVDDGTDEDCDGSELCYVDADGDGYRTGATVYSTDLDCADAGEARATDPTGDCDDAEADANPGEAERCDGLDNDCDGETDPDDAIDVETWYGDADGDGYGVSGSAEIDCDRPAGFAGTAGDCDDQSEDVHPEADETCNERDDDCDDATDENAVDATTWYADDDGDGFGADGEFSPIEACDQPDGYVTGDDDCDEFDSDVHPDADETCNERDDDCDGEIDDSPVNAPTWYLDEDRDGYGLDGDTLVSCARPSGYEVAGGDCDDDDFDVHPNAEDEDYDGEDSDCDGDEERVWVAGKTLWGGCNAAGAPIQLAGILLAALALARRSRRVPLALALPLALVLTSPAAAVERFDAHGFHLAPDDGDLFDLTQTWRPEQQRRFATGLSILGEYARETVVLEQQHGDDIDTDTLRGPFGALNLGASFAVGRRFGVTATVPMFLGSGGQSLGDVRVATPVELWLPAGGGSGGLAFVPFVDVPFGDELYFLGNRGFGGGGVFAFGGGSEAFALNANLGVGYTPLIELENLRGGPRLLAALGAAVRVADSVALRAEATYQPNAFTQPVGGVDSPGEVVLSARGAYAIGASWTAGLAFATSPGAGASPLRLFAGGGFAFGKTALADTDRDGIADTFDTCRAEPETVNDYKDRDGCPDELGNLKVTVGDEDGNVVPDATIAVRDASAVTDAAGIATMQALIPASRALGSVTHLLYADQAFAIDSPVPGLNEIKVKVSFRRQAIKVTARDTAGRPVDARIRFEGPADVGTRFLGADGSNSFDLRPGKWRMLVSTDGLSTERRDFEILPGQNGPIELVFDLRPATAVVDTVKREVVIREQVYFDAGRDTIKAESAPIITQVANVLLDNAGIVQVEVQGHTDSDGDAPANLDLSQRRVEAVCAELMKQGVSAARLVPRGYGETLPIAPNSTPEGRAFNRRVQFSIISMAEIPAEKPPVEK